VRNAPPIRPQIIHALFHELTDEERNLVRRALGYIPTDALQGDYDHLWREYQAGRVQMFHVRDEAGCIVAVSFYVVEILADGSKDFASLSTVALRKGVTGLSEMCLPQFDQLARELGCASMSMRTCRYGLARKLVNDHGWFVSEIVARKLL
jgi:hypothetical protein